MSKQTLAALRCVKAQLEQQRESLKNVILTTHQSREQAVTDSMIMYLSGKLTEAVYNLGRVQGTIRDIQMMIREVSKDGSR